MQVSQQKHGKIKLLLYARRLPYSYIGLTDNAFKKRWSNHYQSFQNEAFETSIELSKLICRLKRADMKYTINWQILTKCQSYKPGARTCN